MELSGQIHRQRQRSKEGQRKPMKKEIKKKVSWIKRTAYTSYSER